MSTPTKPIARSGTRPTTTANGEAAAEPYPAGLRRSDEEPQTTGRWNPAIRERLRRSRRRTAHRARELSQPAQHSRGRSQGTLATALLVGALGVLAAIVPASADAGTYPMYQCGANASTAVAPGWYVYGTTTITSTALSDSCATGGMLGDYAFTFGNPGAVTENGSAGSQVALGVSVPSSVPDVTIDSLAAHVIVSPVSGDDAYLGFSSAGQILPGLTELPYGGSSDYTTNGSWTLPGGARDFETFVNCTTDDASPTCLFSDSTAVPALEDMTLTLSDNVPPVIGSVSGPLADAAARAATVSGTQTLGFDASDVDSGVSQATLTLTPQGGGTPATTTINYPCSYDSWNACPVTENGSALEIDTAAVIDGTYQANLTVSDAAGNVVTDPLGTITTRNAPSNTGVPASIGHDGEVFVGNPLMAIDGGWSAPTGTGTIDYSYQWEDCDAQGNNCAAIAAATDASYTAAPSDLGDTLRVAITAADGDGFQTATSAATAAVLSATGSLGAVPGPGTTPSAGPTSPSGGGAAPPPAGSDATSGLETPNGSVASVSAVLLLGLKRVISRSFATRAFTLRGRLLGPTGAPIAGATLDVLEQVLGATGPMHVIAHAKSGKGGAFSVKVPAGPSRLVEIAYRAYSKNTTYATVARVQEDVAAGVTLTVKPTATSSTGRIVLSGRVEGAVPHQGVVVELLVRYLGHWEPFRSARTTKAGRFHVDYQFQGGRGRFPFRARVRGDQLDFPFTLGQSTIHNVKTPR